VNAQTQLHALKPFTLVWVDSSGDLQLNDIIKKENDFFPLANLNSLANPGKAYWLRIAIQAEGRIKKWWLILNNDSTNKKSTAESETVDVWTLDSNYTVLDHQRTGLMVPRSQKSIPGKPALNRVFFSAENGERRILLLRVYNDFESTEISAPELRDSMVGFPGSPVDLGITFQVGGVMMLCIFSFFLYLFVRDKSYLFFALYTFTLSQHYLLFLPDYPLIQWYVPEHPFWSTPLFFLLAVGGLILFIWFGRYFVNLAKLSPRLDKLLKWGTVIVVAWLLVNVYMLVAYKQQALMPFMFIFILAILTFLIRLAFFKTNLVKIYVSGAIWLFIFTLLGLLSNEGFIDPPFNPWPVGQIGQIIIYTLGIAYKIRENEKEKAQAQLIQIRNVELAGLYEESRRQKEEIEVQKKNAEKALEDLQSAQTQLIHSEKMASLGELTAGIAHEIQNPLNFVNNFSELNSELIDEMTVQLDKGSIDDAKQLAGSIKENEEKIKHHGKRADSIVKGMLQHSHGSTGQKEVTDLNRLVDEYLRLAFHGWKAKDRSFNAKFEFHADTQLPAVRVAAQDLGRVILNLTNNAFYAINERSKKEQGSGYEPMLTVSTMKKDGRIVISFKDNGYGIPASAREKIFQPFYTTKPTGEGTGLGLSLAYDIITKGHGGDIEVKTKGGEGTEFIISIPAV
jgi:signal transduction histidine kinase